MTTEEALNQHFVAAGIYAEGCTRESWYPGHLVSLQFGHWKLPIFPILDRNGPIVLHDVHHMITGYPPTWKGEAEIAGWEIASGGCRWHVLYWLDRLSFLLIGLVAAPVSTWRAFERGKGNRNLYDRDPEEVLETDVAELERYVGA
jgi:hypothetical protein